MTATTKEQREELSQRIAGGGIGGIVGLSIDAAKALIADSERLAAIKAVTGEEVKSMVGQCRFQARYETLDPDYIRFMESVADALLSLSAKVAEQAEEIALLKRQLVRFAKDASEEAERADTAEAECDTLHRLLTETTIPALELAECDRAAMGPTVVNARNALSTIRAHMEGGNG